MTTRRSAPNLEGFATVSLTVHPDDVESLKGLLMAYLLPYAGTVSIGHVWAMDKPRHGYVYDVKCPIDNVKELSDTARELYARRVTDVEQVRDRILGGVLQEVDAPRVETVDDIRG
ncbi:MAG: hypothetical protein ACR652_18660 [Methylocystis sp.]|uniref:hypothetical protein n=1 Tax=Methylocystis sp. TaxID=1911079 RepID=UPI003DA54AE2